MVQGNESAVTIHNLSSIPQSIFFENQRYTLPENAVETLPAPIARAFLSERARWVVTYNPIAVPKMDGFQDVWIANTTGNPFLANATVKLKRKVHGRWEDYDAPHPLRQPRIVTERVGQGQVAAKETEGDQDTVLNLPKLEVRIPPYTRVKVPAPIANRLMERDGQRTDGWSGMISPAREPSVFEPNETWGYDEVRLYAGLFAPHIYAEKIDPTKHGPFPPEEALKGDEKKIHAAKRALLDMLFFQLINEEYPLVSHEEYSKAKFEMDLEKQTAPKLGKLKSGV